MRALYTLSIPVAALALSAAAFAKLPPLSEEAKTNAAEAAAKTAHGNKVAEYKLCLTQEKVAARYMADAKKAGKEVKPAVQTPACADPGPFVAAPPAVAPAAAPAPAAPAKKS